MKRKKAGEKQPYHHGDLRAALIKAALLLIDKHGIKGFSLKDAATNAGVSTAAPYRHFADKDALLSAIKSEGFALFDASLATAFAVAEDPQAKIVELGIAYVRFALQHPTHFRVMFSLRGDGKSELEGGSNSGFLLLVKAVAALHPHALADVRNDLVLVCWSLVHGFAILQLDEAFEATMGIGDPEERLRRALTLLMERTVE